MTLDEQAYKLIEIAQNLDAATNSPELLANSYGVNEKLSFHLEGPLFVAIARISKETVNTTYLHSAIHAEILIGVTKFVYCHNLL